MPFAVYLNETDLSTLGVYVENVGDWFGAPRRTYPTQPIPGRQGAVIAGDPTTETRTLTVSCMIQPSALTLAARRTAEDQLKALAYRALIKIVNDDGVNAPRAIDGLCIGCTVTPRRHPTVNLVSDAQLTVLCPDPTWYDVTGQIIGFSSIAAAVPLGTAPSGGVIRLAIPHWSADVTDPTITYLSAGGVTRGSLAFTALTLGAGTDYLEVDLDRATCTRYTSGSAINVLDKLSSGDFFALDPMDGDVLNASYPQLKVTSTAGTPSGQWLGVRRWL